MTRRSARPGGRRSPRVATRAPQQFVFVDESGAHTALTRLYGGAPHDQRATGSVPRNHGKHTTLVGALTPAGLQAPGLIAGAIHTETGEWYIREELAPRLRPGQVVVLDHLSAHKATSIRQALAARQCERLFRPPSSPNFTPNEQAFSKSKALVRGLGARTKEALQEAVRLAIEVITSSDTAVWFAHAGYALPDQGNWQLLLSKSAKGWTGEQHLRVCQPESTHWTPVSSSCGLL